MSWIRLPLVFGTLKIKPRRQLRREEWTHEIPVWRLGSLYFTWRPRSYDRRQPRHNDTEKRSL
jgi:hypothetical protein